MKNYQKRLQRIEQHDKKIKDRLSQLGIEYDFPSVVSMHKNSHNI